MAKVLITKSKLDTLAQHINDKTGASGAMTIAEMQAAVDDIVTPNAPVTWSQVNPVAAAYLAAADYDPADYSVSIIDNYANQSTAYRKDWPTGADVQVSTGDLLVVDTQGRRQKKSVTGGTETIYNLAPGAADYLVQQGGIIGGCGHLIPTGALRMIAAPSAINVRDLGGWACDGGTIKYGKLFRGGALSASARGVLVDYLGIAVDLDLRGATEAGITASPLGDDVEFVCPSTYAMYSLANTAALTEVLRCIFNAVALGKPLYFHCAVGADRTATVACIVELLLGVAQGDVDKDYELTSFYTLRARNGSYQGGTLTWAGLMSEISALEGSTMRDKIVNWVYSLGFTAAEINAFRAAMIDGAPETVTPLTHTYSITSTLSNATSDNSETSVEQNKAYSAKIFAAKGYVISDVKVKMGGTDITSQVWDGSETNLYRSVSLTLTNCVADNSRRAVIDGQAYACTLTADAGYTLDGATVSITMGGVDVSTYYKDGIIAIPKVTGNLEITVNAVMQGPAYENLLDTVGYLDGKRVSLNSGLPKDAANRVFLGTIDGGIPCTYMDIIRVKGLTYPNSDDETVCIGIFIDGTWGTAVGGKATYLKNTTFKTNWFKYAVDDAGVLSVEIINNESTVTGLRLNGIGTTGANVIITKNQEIN